MRHVTSFRSLFLSLVALAICFSALRLPLRAQSAFGSIVGTVTDASGSAAAHTAVTLTNVGTAEKKIAQTDPNGAYQFLDLLPARIAWISSSVDSST